MLRTSFLGVVDRFEESMVGRPVFPSARVSGAGLLGRAHQYHCRRGSTSEKRKALVREACDSRIYSELLRLNAMDSKLVDLARAEVERRFRCVPPSALDARTQEQRVLICARS